MLHGTKKIIMKAIKISMLLFVALLMSFTSIQPRIDQAINSKMGKIASIKWKHVELDLGEIVQNKPVTVEFEFTNNGEMPVIISGVQASCGCTGTAFSHNPVLPGETSKVTAVYNAAIRGSFKKTVTVTSNAGETSQTLTFMGSVI